mgnify:CR=1 FL=1
MQPITFIFEGKTYKFLDPTLFYAFMVENKDKILLIDTENS